MDALASAKIDYFNGIVAQGADEKPVTPAIASEMVNSAFHARQRDRFCQGE
jgi:hypothetical protein